MFWSVILLSFFKAFVNKVLCEILNCFVIAHINDILFFLVSEQEQIAMYVRSQPSYWKITCNTWVPLDFGLVWKVPWVHSRWPGSKESQNEFCLTAPWCRMSSSSKRRMVLWVPEETCGRLHLLWSVTVMWLVTVMWCHRMTIFANCYCLTIG